MSRVRIINADIKAPIRDKRHLYEWVKSVITSEGKEAGSIDIIFCSDQFLLDINKRFLNHDYFTDIITFDYSSDGLISGEMYISYDRVIENAADLKINTLEELRRVIIHGVLHLCGFKDKTSSERLKMREKEDEKLSMLAKD